MTYAVKIPKFTVIELFIFPVEDFQFFKILWKEAKHGKRNFQREFDRYNQGRITEKISLKFCKLTSFCE